jgi:hypothetical protein
MLAMHTAVHIYAYIISTDHSVDCCCTCNVCLCVHCLQGGASAQQAAAAAASTSAMASPELRAKKIVKNLKRKQMRLKKARAKEEVAAATGTTVVSCAASGCSAVREVCGIALDHVRRCIRVVVRMTSTQ